MHGAPHPSWMAAEAYGGIGKICIRTLENWRLNATGMAYALWTGAMDPASASFGLKLKGESLIIHEITLYTRAFGLREGGVETLLLRQLTTYLGLREYLTIDCTASIHDSDKVVCRVSYPTGQYQNTKRSAVHLNRFRSYA